jgi:hypothetical protein
MVVRCDSRIRWGALGVVALMLSSGAVVVGQSDEPGRRAGYLPLLGTSSEPEEAQDLVRATTLAAPGPLSNFAVPASHRSLVQMMWEKSSTFRSQCERIAREPMLTVRVHPFPHSAIADASTRLVHSSGTGLVADVYLGEPNRVVELLAHEIEHIIEWLDGVDVREMARRAPNVVRAVVDGVYETTRAVHSGRTVASEVANARN